MKRIIYFTFILLGLAILSSCEKEDGPKIANSDSFLAAEINTPAEGANIILLKANENETIKFKWTIADYGIPVAVQYVIQADKSGNNFASPKTVVSATADSAKLTVSALNTLLLSMSLPADAQSEVEFRIMSFIPDVEVMKDTIYSETVAINITPYATTFPPIYMCGAAVGGWDWNKSVEMRSSAAYQYSTIAYFYTNEAFRFFAQHDWNPTSYNYPYFTTVSALFENAGDGDSNFKFKGTTGYYEVAVNLQTKVVTMTAVDEPTMFMTGAALGGWDWTTNFVQMTWKSNGVFEATTEFINGEAFRFFKSAGWGTSYNYPYFTTVSPLLVNANDGDSNFKVSGATGNYKITVNMLDKVVTMVLDTK